MGIRLAPVVAGVLAISGMALWHRYRLPDTMSREAVAEAGLAASQDRPRGRLTRSKWGAQVGAPSVVHSGRQAPLADQLLWIDDYSHRSS